jgi:hypothetical protein
MRHSRQLSADSRLAQTTKRNDAHGLPAVVAESHALMEPVRSDAFDSDVQQRRLTSLHLPANYRGDEVCAFI